MKYQQGVGLVEVLVALILLAIAILGFTALQLRAVSASMEAGNSIYAINLARDLSERMYLNRDGSSVYRQMNSTNVSDQQINGNLNTCNTSICNATQLATYDVNQIYKKAKDAGMDIAVLDCQGSTLKRSCIYVAWGDTTPTNGSGSPNCTNGTSYVNNATCVILEAYNYD